jgi:predicted O-linked N-acetylglucosamine transferase (SPINDLY family)
VAAYRHALRIQPDYLEAELNLGNALASLGRFEDAVAHFRRVLASNPTSVEALNNLGNALREQGKLDEAVGPFREALELQPRFAEGHNNLGAVLAGRGQIEEAVAEYRRAVELKPEYGSAQSNLLYALHFLSGCDRHTIAGEHERWNRECAEPFRKCHPSFGNVRDPGRRLRIGYVSPDFNRHPIGYFFLPLIESHNKERVEVYCYASVARPDGLTERIKKSADVWRDMLGVGDAALAGRIRADQIDILVDLTQHMAGNRMLTFARKPAPVQVSWLGYPVTTGLSAMDYRFTDSFMEPEGCAWSESVETPIRLPNAWFCYQPVESPEVAPLPAMRTGRITFGSLNNIGKINEAVVRCWSAVLQAVEGSRLLLHCPAGAAQSRLERWFGAHGISSERLELIPRTATRAEFLRLFKRVDIGLDPFPYNGGTTTCDALWMGVPVVSRAGESAVSRLGLSVLSNAGLPEWVASSEEEYVGIAVRLARDLLALSERRATLRTRMRGSPLMDAARFARDIEAAYGTMWERWCATEVPESNRANAA